MKSKKVQGLEGSYKKMAAAIRRRYNRRVYHLLMQAYSMGAPIWALDKVTNAKLHHEIRYEARLYPYPYN